jgi:hypothetical protein
MPPEEDRPGPDERMARVEKLESLAQLAGGIAHDFNNLLAVITMRAEFAAEAAKGNPALAEDIANIRQAAEQAAVLTHKLLVFGRKDSANPEVVDLGRVVGETEPLITGSIGEAVKLEIKAAPGLWPVMADPRQVEQAVLNLAINARDAMPDGGRLTIEIANFEPLPPAESEPPPPKQVVLKVADTGSGMSKEVAAKAFEPFFTTKPKGRGTGLGLASVYGIVTQLGGTVEIESEPGVGTAISLFFPASEDAIAHKPVEAPESAMKGRGETVLVVDDEPGVRELTVRTLATHGYRVIEKKNAGEALLVLHRQDRRIDLLLTDIVMPVLSGIDLAVEAKRIRPGIKVLYVSGSAEDLLVERTSDFDAAYIRKRLLPKPFTREALLRRVRSAIDSA